MRSALLWTITPTCIFVNSTPYIQIPTLREIPNTAVLTPSNFFSSCIRKAISKHEEISQSSLIHDAFPLYRSSSVAVVGASFGASAAALTAETLFSSGVTRLLVFGFAGGLGFHPSTPKAGEIVVGENAICETGIAALYNEESELLTEPSEFRAKVVTALRSEHPTIALHQGTVWSSSVPFEESAQKAQEYAGRGAVAVDMEYAALLSVAKKYEVELAGVFIISDILHHEHQPHFSSVKRSGVVQSLSETLCTSLLSS